MHLFDATMHEPLTGTPWDAAHVKEVADRIASDTAAACEPDGSWPPHPLDGVAEEPDYSFWTGAAGIRWSLARLGHDVDEGGLLAGYRSLSDGGAPPGLMHGEVGVLLASWKLEPTPEKEERLFDLVALGPVTISGSIVHACSRCTRSSRSTAPSRGTRSGRGVALYLGACVGGWDGMPVLDVV